MNQELFYNFLLQAIEDSFDSWECHTCGKVIDRFQDEPNEFWQDRIFRHMQKHKNPIKKKIKF